MIKNLYDNIKEKLKDCKWVSTDKPTDVVGLGEGMDDLEYFDIEKYIYGLFAELIDEDEDNEWVIRKERIL